VAVTFLAMGVITRAMRVAMPIQDKISNNVRGESNRTNNQDQHGVSDLRRVDESRNRLEDNGDAKGDQENGVEECAEDLSSLPLPSSSVVSDNSTVNTIHSPQSD